MKKLMLAAHWIYKRVDIVSRVMTKAGSWAYAQFDPVSCSAHNVPYAFLSVQGQPASDFLRGPEAQSRLSSFKA